MQASILLQNFIVNLLKLREKFIILLTQWRVQFTVFSQVQSNLLKRLPL